jgi:hypothetical protein
MKSKKLFIGLLILQVLIIVFYVSYNSLVVFNYDKEYENLEDDAVNFVMELDTIIKNSYKVSEKCDNETKCTLTIKMTKLDGMEDYEFYYNEQVNNSFVLLKENNVVLPKELKGIPYDISYGKLTSEGLIVEVQSSVKSAVEDTLYDMLYEEYAEDKILDHKKETKNKINDVEKKIDGIYLGILK